MGNPGLPAWIDVRDVAKACVASLSLPGGQNDRVLLFSGTNYYEDGLKSLRESGVQGLGEPGAVADPKNHFSLDKTGQRDILGLATTIPFQQTVEDTYRTVQALALL